MGTFRPVVLCAVRDLNILASRGYLRCRMYSLTWMESPGFTLISPPGR